MRFLGQQNPGLLHFLNKHRKNNVVSANKPITINTGVTIMIAVKIGTPFIESSL